MSYDIQTDQQFINNLKHCHSICSTNECLSSAQRNSHCAKSISIEFYKQLQSREKITNRNRMMNNQSCRNLQNKTQCWSTSPAQKISTDHSSLSIDEILSKFQHHLEQDLITETFPLVTSSSLGIDDDDAKSQSSIEYDYTNPLPMSTTSDMPQRHISIATIYLQDEQWHQLELFIKHFSSSVSLSNNLNVTSSTTHLLIDDSSMALQCIFSKKIFQAVARHIFIVSIQWIEECLLRNQIIDETPFEIQGDGTMSTMHLARQSSAIPLFSPSVSFAIDCNSFQRVLTRHELAELAILTGATLFDPEQNMPTKILLVLADPTADRYQLREKYRKWHENIKFLTPGFLLKSIIYQQEQPFEDFEL